MTISNQEVNKILEYCNKLGKKFRLPKVNCEPSEYSEFACASQELRNDKRNIKSALECLCRSKKISDNLYSLLLTEICQIRKDFNFVTTNANDTIIAIRSLSFSLKSFLLMIQNEAKKVFFDIFNEYVELFELYCIENEEAEAEEDEVKNDYENYDYPNEDEDTPEDKSFYISFEKADDETYKWMQLNSIFCFIMENLSDISHDFLPVVAAYFVGKDDEEIISKISSFMEPFI